MGFIGSGLGGAGAGAATGAAIGSIIPGLGTAVGAGIGGLAGLFMGGVSGADANAIDPNKSYKDLGFFDRASATIAAKTEGLTRDVAGFFGVEDAVGTENKDLLSRLQHERRDDAGTSFQTGGNISGGSSGGLQAPQMGGMGAGGQTPSQGISLGRALALEEEPALQDQNYNNNNFSF